MECVNLTIKNKLIHKKDQCGTFTRITPSIEHDMKTFPKSVFLWPIKGDSKLVILVLGLAFFVPKNMWLSYYPNPSPAFFDMLACHSGGNSRGKPIEGEIRVYISPHAYYSSLFGSGNHSYYIPCIIAWLNYRVCFE